MKVCKVCRTVGYDYEVQCRHCGTSTSTTVRRHDTGASSANNRIGTTDEGQSVTYVRPRYGIAGTHLTPAFSEGRTAADRRYSMRRDGKKSCYIVSGTAGAYRVRKVSLACGYGQGRFSPRWGRRASRI